MPQYGADEATIMWLKLWETSRSSTTAYKGGLFAQRISSDTSGNSEDANEKRVTYQCYNLKIKNYS